MKAVPALLTLCCISGLAADDPAGWSKLRWGMTVAEIQTAAPEATFDLAGLKFHTITHTDKSDHLERVHLSPVNMADNTDALFRSLEEMLVSKYGRPWKSTEEKNVTEEQWTFPTTLIVLRRENFPLIKQVLGPDAPGATLIGIDYRRKPADLDKL